MKHNSLILMLVLWTLTFHGLAAPIPIHEGTNMAAALSPDKKTLAIDLQGVIWLLPVTGGNARPITDPLGDNHEPAWSPDGKQLAFQSYRNGVYHIWTINCDGTDLQELTHSIWDDREACWSTDGKSIYFSSDRNGNGTNIWQVNVADQQVQQLTFSNADHHPTVTAANHLFYISDGQKPGLYRWISGKSARCYASPFPLSAPSCSPDGKQVIVVEYSRETSRLLLWSHQGQKVRILSAPDDDIFPFKASWVSNETFYYTANGHINRQHTTQKEKSVVHFTADIQLTKIAYNRKTYDFDSHQRKPVLGIAGPVISPSGNQVAFSALGNLYIQESNSRELHQITQGNSVHLDPEWSSDGKTLIYVSDSSGKMDLWQYDLATKKTHLLLASEMDHPISMPAWSADQSKIAFYTKGPLNDWGNAQLCILDRKTGRVTKCPIPPLFSPGKPSWSPDGRFLIVSALVPFSSRFREGSNQFLLVNTETWQTHYLNPDSTQNRAMRSKNGPIWSPDGKKVAYIQDGRLWYSRISPSGALLGSPIRLTDSLAESISWFGDSERILYLAVNHLQSVAITNKETKAIPLSLYWEPAYPQESFTIWAGKLFNGVDSNYLENVDIIISGHRIQDIHPHQANSPLALIDAHDKTVIPGLFEMHAHQHFNVGEKLGKLWLSMGITSVREPGADPYDALERKEAWTSGSKIGPRLFTTGGLLEGKRAYYGLSNSIGSKEQVNMELERAQKLDYDLVKTYVRFPDSLQRYVIEQAHKLGIPVSSHDIFPASKYSIDAVEHFRGTSRRGYSPKQTALNKTYQDVFAILLGSGINITPTIVMHEGFQKAIHQFPTLAALPQFKRFYSSAYIEEWKNRKIPDNYGPNFPEFQQDVYRVVNNGGKLTAGTDAPFVPYGISLHTELWLYVDGGLSPYQALQTATINAARALGVDHDLGTVEKGKLADLVIVDGDPLHEIKDSANIKIVIKNGQFYQIEELLKKNK